MDSEHVSAGMAQVMAQIAAAADRAARQEAQQSTAPPVDWTRGEAHAWLQAWMRRSNIPLEYRDAVVERAYPLARETVQRWAAHVTAYLDAGRGEIILGPKGTGKSSTAALLAAEALKVRQEVGWWYVPDLTDMMLANSRARQEVVTMLAKPPLVVLDDFGVRPFSDFEVGILDQIVERRYRTRKSTIVTSNMTLDYLKASVNQGQGGDGRLARMLDRLRQRNKATIISGKSMRSTT